MGFSWHFLGDILQRKPWSTEHFQSIREISLLKGVSQENQSVGAQMNFQGKRYTIENSEEVIIKWRKYGAILTLPVTGCPTKIDKKKKTGQGGCQESYSNNKGTGAFVKVEGVINGSKTFRLLFEIFRHESI